MNPLQPNPLQPNPLQPNPLQPSPQLLCKLGSVIVHADEMTGPGAHEYDRVSFETVLKDPEVQAWIAAMNKMAMQIGRASCREREGQDVEISVVAVVLTKRQKKRKRKGQKEEEK